MIRGILGSLQEVGGLLVKRGTETARMQMIAAKQFPYPIPAENLSLDDPRENPAVPDAAAEEDAPPASTDADEEKLS